MDFLKDLGISKQTIEEMESNFYPSLLFDFKCNEEQVIAIIVYLQSIGITVIEDLLCTQIDLFLHTKEEVEALFQNYQIPLLVSQINQDSVNMPFFA